VKIGGLNVAFQRELCTAETLLNVRCPACGEGVGQPCRVLKARHLEMASVHPERRRVAIRAEIIRIADNLR
jgi:hypothetical protein